MKSGKNINKVGVMTGNIVGKEGMDWKEESSVGLTIRVENY